MKKVYLLIVILFCAISTFSQGNTKDYYMRLWEVKTKFFEKDYYSFIIKVDSLIADYPKEYELYTNRGIAKLNMNDFISAKSDLLKAQELGARFKNDYFTFITSKSYAVNLLAEDQIDLNLLSPENNFKPVYSLKDSLQGSLRQERTCFDVYYYNLTIKILPRSRSIEGVNEIYFRTVEQTKKIQIDLSDNFRIHYITWNGEKLKFKRICNALFIDFEEMLEVDENHVITIKYSGSPRTAPSPPWNGGFVWEKKRGSHWVGVACEHLGASSWWPCKDHLTEKPDSMSINIQVPSKYQAIANGNLRSSYSIDKKYTNYEWFVSYPINSYGVSFYMGKFVNFSEVYTNSNCSYNIDYYVLPHNLEIAKEYYSQTHEIVSVYEKLFGEYPYKDDGIAMIEAPYAGMEHQSAIAIGDEYGREKRRTYENTEYDYLVVHELAHEWWGNTVTMSDMADAWISEGFATYSEHLLIEEKFGYEEYISASAETMNYIFNIWPMVGTKDVNDNSFLGGDIYTKGAAMLNNLRCTINNDETFFDLIKNFYKCYQFKTITSSDFVNFVNEYTGNDYSDFFNKFLYDVDPPILQYEFIFEDDNLTFTYKWINVGENFEMPFSITLNDNYNYRLVARTDSQTIKFENIKTFYLPNKNRYNKDIISRNSFTYYWTSWKH